MIRATLLGVRVTTVAAALALVVVAVTGGCDSCNTTPTVTGAGGAAPDGGTGGAAPDGGPTCDKHLPPGFTQAVVSSGLVASFTGNSESRAAAMALDENDDPMFAYGSDDVSPSVSINFTRWDPCAGQFTAPIQVDTTHGFGSSPDVSIAYDPTTKEVGIAYVKGWTDNGWADASTEIWLGTMKAPATAFTVQPLTTAGEDYYAAAAPSIAMGGGKIFIAYAQGPYPHYGPSYVLWFLSSTDTPGGPTDSPPPALDGGSGGAGGSGAGPDAGPPPPHYFAYTAVPFSSPSGNGYLYPLPNSGTTSVAIGSDGVPGVASYHAPDETSTATKTVVFWRPGTPSAVGSYTFSLDAAVDISLAFDGTKPRIAGHMDPSAGSPPLDSLAFLASDDGVTWSQAVHLPLNGSEGTAFDSSLAVDGQGNAAVASDINGGGGTGMPCGMNPYVATTTADDGTGTWTVCGADTAGVHDYGASSITARYGAGRLKGTLVLAFASGASTPADGGADQGGILYWQHP